MQVGFKIGSTTLKNVCNGLHPSIMAASSISSGMPYTNPQNINTARPAPKPRYTGIIPTGLYKCNIFANFDNVNITIWNGTIIENKHRQYIPFENLEFTLEIYHAHIDVHKIIHATENTVINKEFLNASKKCILSIPLT